MEVDIVMSTKPPPTAGESASYTTRLAVHPPSGKPTRNKHGHNGADSFDGLTKKPRLALPAMAWSVNRGKYAPRLKPVPGELPTGRILIGVSC
jgi:hypothetical protein